ncbi:1030_t:CDS:2 [Ambispora gerdemannii]|uniref:1030_t:CDS:1 n=1 Tax=Ambispora gerdemannii TaxID=144530 RepID=A0A9N8Z5D5_9GLOM|nr:1030_t:CDS:2 [Ambispora gerdemannii]
MSQFTMSLNYSFIILIVFLLNNLNAESKKLLVFTFSPSLGEIEHISSRYNVSKLISLGDNLHVLPGEFDSELHETIKLESQKDWWVTEDIVVRKINPVNIDQFEDIGNGGCDPPPPGMGGNLSVDPGAVKFKNITNGITVQSNVKSWGLDRIDQRIRPLSKTYNFEQSAGEGVDVYVVDTGININHVDFEGRARWGLNAVPDTVDNDLLGHGTFVAGIIGGKVYGVAKKVNLIAVKCLDDRGEGTLNSILYGFEYVMKQHNATKRPAIANLSFGTERNKLVDMAVNQLVSAGIIVVAAAGNGDEYGRPEDACNSSPAASRLAITVGATSTNDTIASWSNRGPCITLFAPGQSVTSDLACTNHNAGVESGTSFSAPYVSGIIALMLSKYKESNLNPQSIMIYLTQLATKDVIRGLPKTRSPNLLAYSQVQELEEVIGGAVSDKIFGIGGTIVCHVVGVFLLIEAIKFVLGVGGIYCA